MRTICVSLPVRNLAVSKAFFAELGFTLSRECSGEGTACIIVDRNIYVMLVAEDRFRDAVDGEIRWATAGAGLVTSLWSAARGKWTTVAKAIAVGGKPWPIMEERPVCSGSFQDLDGHVWQLPYPTAEAGGRHGRLPHRHIELPRSRAIDSAARGQPRHRPRRDGCFMDVCERFCDREEMRWPG